MFQRQRHAERRDPAEILIGKAAVRDQSEPRAEPRVITEVRMHIQRQMISKQIDVVLDQRPEPLILAPGDLRRLVAPEVAVMDEHGIRAPLARRLEKRERRRDAVAIF